MATLKLKHLVLYFTCFTLLYISDFPGAALLALVSWFQVAVLLWRLPFTAKTQLQVLVFSLTLLPLYVLWGSSMSLVGIYLKEGALLFAFFSGLCSYLLCILALTFSVFAFKNAAVFLSVDDYYARPLASFKKEKKQILLFSIFVFIAILIPFPLKPDFEIVLGVVTAHLFLNRKWASLSDQEA